MLSIYKTGKPRAEESKRWASTEVHLTFNNIETRSTDPATNPSGCCCGCKVKSKHQSKHLSHQKLNYCTGNLIYITDNLTSHTWLRTGQTHGKTRETSGRIQPGAFLSAWSKLNRKTKAR